MKADNVTSLDKEREVSEASKLAQGHFLGPLFRSVTPPSFGEMVERVGCVGQFPPSCHIEVKPNMQSMALLWLWEASSFWDEKYSPGLPDFLGNYHSRSLPSDLLHLPKALSDFWSKYFLLNTCLMFPYYKFSFLVFWHTSLTSCLPHPRFSNSCYSCSGGTHVGLEVVPHPEWPQVAGNKGLCTVGTAVFGSENLASIDQVGVSGEWNRHSEEQRWYWGEARRETQEGSCS